MEPHFIATISPYLWFFVGLVLGIESIITVFGWVKMLFSFIETSKTRVSKHENDSK